jgi:GNAT superfamily N-acetyltransferase
LWAATGAIALGADPAPELALVGKLAHVALFVGMADGKVAGTIRASHEAAFGWIDRFAVAAEARKRGHGVALLRHAEGWLVANNVQASRIMVPRGNADGRDFLAHVGYAIEPGHIMSRVLAGTDAPDFGRLPVVVTYLEMTHAPTRPTIPAPAAAGRLALLRAENPPVDFYRYLYTVVGESWFWYERSRLDDAVLAGIIRDPKVEIYVLHAGGVPAGFAELDRRPAPDINIAYFGLMPQFVGRGLGPYLLGWTVDTAWQYRPRRLTVDTCTLDHPKALSLYQRAGFVPVRQVTKSIDDPRRAGLIAMSRQPRLP